MKRFLSPGLLAILTIIVVMTAVAVAQTPAPPNGTRLPHSSGMGARTPHTGLPPVLIEHLKLTDDQRSAIRGLTDQHRAAQHANMEVLAGLRQQLDAQVFADAPDAAQVKQLVAQIGAAEGQALAAQVDLRLAIARILTPEQRAEALAASVRGPAGRRMPHAEKTSGVLPHGDVIGVLEDLLFGRPDQQKARPQ